MHIAQLVQDAWSVNDEMNRVLLAALTPELLRLRTPDGAWSIAGTLAHLAASKKWWMSHLDPEGAQRLPDLARKVGGEHVPETDLTILRAVFEETSRTLLEAAERAADPGALPYASIDKFLLHMVVHDAHHRGQIAVVLRAAGHRPPEDDELWGPWWTE